MGMGWMEGKKSRSTESQKKKKAMHQSSSSKRGKPERLLFEGSVAETQKNDLLHIPLPYFVEPMESRALI